MSQSATRSGPTGSSTPSVPRLLRVRAALSREVNEQLSHGEPQAMKLVDDLLRIEEQIMFADPVLYARRQGSWARAEAAQLHTPGNAPRTCSRCGVTGETDGSAR